jgi:hypothetical protein
MSRSISLRKHELECLRLEADCLQLAATIHDASLKSHFIRMAKEWASLATRGLEMGLEHECRGQLPN